MMHSVGRTVPSATNTTLFTVPNGFVAHLNMVFVSNTSGSTGSMSFYWEHAHDSSHKIYILNGTSVGSKDYIQFTNGLVVMQSGDKLVFNPTTEMNVIVTSDLLQRPPLYTFDGE